MQHSSSPILLPRTATFLHDLSLQLYRLHELLKGLLSMLLILVRWSLFEPQLTNRHISRLYTAHQVLFDIHLVKGIGVRIRSRMFTFSFYLMLFLRLFSLWPTRSSLLRIGNFHFFSVCFSVFMYFVMLDSDLLTRSPTSV